jgi:ribulose-phosphate 3-epimerase
MSNCIIAPSILSADFARLGEEVDSVLAAGADWVHFDVMDNHYVPNLTIGPLVCSALRKHGVTAPIDVHLMVEPVDRIVPDFAEAGASIISFHPEASRHVHRTIQLIKSHGCKAGLVLNPGTPVDALDWVLEDLDLVLLMSVNPGFGGQAFIPSALDKLRAVRAKIDATGKDIRLEIDGGVKAENIGEIAAAGADAFVAGQKGEDLRHRPGKLEADPASARRPCYGLPRYTWKMTASLRLPARRQVRSTHRPVNRVK